MADERHGTILPPGKGQSYWLVTDHVTLKATAAETGGAYTTFETIVPPGGGPPPHIHLREDEAFYVLEGEFEFLSDDQTIPASQGTFVHTPMGHVHSFKNIGDSPARVLITTSPSGFENFIAEAGVPVSEAVPVAPPPDMAHVGRVAAKYGIELRSR